MDEKLNRLFQRLDENLADFTARWKDRTTDELIDASGEINAIKDAHYYLTESHGFEEDEADYLLLFDNPLEVVADKWRERTGDLSDFSFALDEVFDKRDALRDYPQKADESPSVLAKLRGMSNLTDKSRMDGKEADERHQPLSSKTSRR